MEINEGEYLIWKTADGVWEVRLYSDHHATPRHFVAKESPTNYVIKSGCIYLVLEESVRDDEDQIYGEHGYLIETTGITTGEERDYLMYEEFHIDRDEPTSDPLSYWDQMAGSGNVIEMKEL